MKTMLPRFVSAACTLIAASALADTKLITDGSALRYLVPTNPNLGDTWRGRVFNDASWTAGQNGIGYEVNPGSYNAAVIADSRAEFSTLGQQGESAWINGYYNQTLDPDGTYQATDFQPFPRSEGAQSAQNFWDGSGWNWFNADPPWTEIYSTAVHPNGVNYAEEHWAIRRWVSTVNGPITLRFQGRKNNTGGTGVTGKAFKNGVELFTRTIAGSDNVGFDVYLNVTAAVGDAFDFALTPLGLGGDPTDGADGSATIATILSGTVTPPPAPPQPEVLADSAADWSSSGTQGANNWYYGFYNQTADADGIYDPNTEFNTTDPMWTFSGGAWQLGRAPDPLANPPWDTISQTSWHPNGNNNLPEGIHWSIRRWLSEVSGDLHARVRFAKGNISGNGTTLHVMHNGVKRLSVVLNHTNFIDTIVSLPGVLMGDKIEFALSSQGIDGGFGDGSDTSSLIATVFRGAPLQTPLADSIRDWVNNTQGANGWFYGYYNQTADADGGYNPSSDFNTADPNWTFLGATWQLGVTGNPGANPPWTAIGQTFWHPNGTNQVQGTHWAIKRWVSNVDGDMYANVRFGKQNTGGGNGTTLRVLRNGVQVFSFTVAAANGGGVNTNIALPGVLIGDRIEFALDPTGTDNLPVDPSDGSWLHAAIFPGSPPQPPRPFLPGVAADIRTDIETAMKGVNPSVFIRIPFNVADLSAIETLKLKIKYNDGFAAYLNGVEVAKRNAPTAVTGTVADSMLDWSTNPDVIVNGWTYGYYNQSLDPNGSYEGGSDFTPFPHDGGGFSATDFWTGTYYDWFNGNPPWLELARETTHPSAPNGRAFDPNIPDRHIHWATRRWTSTVDGDLKARIRFRKTNLNGGDGVRVSLFHNSLQIYSQAIGGTDGIGRDDQVDLPGVFIGDNIDIMLGPGDNGQDGADGSAFSLVLFSGEPTVPWNAAATALRTTTESISPEVIDLTGFKSALVSGANVLAIQGINGAVGDNEFLINAELLANRVPTAVDDNVRAVMNTTTTFPASAFLGNDSDPDGDQLLLVGVTPSYVTTQGGAVRLWGDTVRYTPAAGFTGTDTFTYTMTDLSGVPRRATVSVRVTPPNQCPTSTPSNVVVDQSAVANFQLHASDPDGDPLQYIVTQPPTGGTLVVNAQTGAATFTAAPNACGTNIFKFKVTDGACESGEATVSIVVRDRTPPQLVCPAPIVVREGNPVTIIPPIAGDECDGPRPSTCVRADAKPLGDPYPVGTTVITCSASDSSLNQASCSFTVTVLPANNAPACVARIAPGECGFTFTADGKLYSIAPNGDYVCLMLDGSGSSDPDGDALTISWVIDETNTVSGAVVPACLDVGCHTITMTVSDGRDRCQQSLDICVIAPEEAVELCILLVESTNVERRNKRPLLVSLKAAKAAFTRDGLIPAVQMLKAFEHKVHAQIEPQNPAEAAAFVQAVENILDALECAIQTPRRDE
jgi:Big-like domain-containing protein/HYR domain-containing protein